MTNLVTPAGNSVLDCQIMKHQIHQISQAASLRCRKCLPLGKILGNALNITDPNFLATGKHRPPSLLKRVKTI